MHLIEGPDIGDNRRKEEEKSAATGRIRTHNLVSFYSWGMCSTAAPQLLPDSIHLFLTGSGSHLLFSHILLENNNLDNHNRWRKLGKQVWEKSRPLKTSQLFYYKHLQPCHAGAGILYLLFLIYNSFPYYIFWSGGTSNQMQSATHYKWLHQWKF